MGSNMAECHPVGFQWVMEAKLRGARVMHVDPRYTRTSANSSLHAPIRAGSDIAFLGGVVNYILQNDRWFKDYVLSYTNASTIVSADYQDAEDLDGLFSGWRSDEHGYDPTSWHYDGMEHAAASDQRAGHAAKGEPPGGLGGKLPHPRPERD